MAGSRMKTIGIIGGSTDVATAEYYKILNTQTRKRLGGLHTARVIINSMDVADSTHYVQNGLWEQGGEMLHGMAKALERAGAEMILCVSNTWHRMAETWMEDVSMPLLHIVDPTAEAIKAAGLSKVALLGTKASMEASFLIDRYRAKFGIEVIVPEAEEQDLISRIIFDELACWKFTAESKSAYLRIVDGLRERGAQGVILGCTEIPLLINQADRPTLPMFDTLQLHAEAAVVMALRE
jgi:aspartate racemase